VEPPEFIVYVCSVVFELESPELYCAALCQFDCNPMLQILWNPSRVILRSVIEAQRNTDQQHEAHREGVFS
jgi:hypothetical protein